MIQTAKGPHLAQVDKASVDPVALQAALLGLHKRFPTDTVCAWWNIEPDGHECVTFRLKEREEIGLPNTWGHGDTMDEALNRLIQCAGGRDPATIRLNRIAQLRAEIAKLEATL